MSDQHIESNQNPDTTTIKDVEQLGTFAALASLGYVFWVCGGMEMVERLAYYGVRQVSGLYATDAVSRGGLGLLESDLGIIFAVWAITQTFVPVFTGGLSDRVGYKQTIFASTILKIIGYLIMAEYASFWGFLCGAMVLAFGTGVFKPGIQATIVKSTNRRNSSMAWGAFYQTVNIGAFLGPVVAAQMRQLAWENVFYACAAIIACNFLLLLIYKEPGKEERLARREAVRNGEVQQVSLFTDSLRELKNPVLLWYIALLSGFYFMLYMIWDVGPLYFRDWVDTRPLVEGIFGADGTDNQFWIFFLGLSRDGTVMLPEGLINLNAMLIMFTCFLVAGVSARLKAVNSMAIGSFLASSALIVFGGWTGAWLVVMGIAMFSIGEMLSAPKSSEYLGNIAPADKKAMFLGFSQLPLGIGWSLESYLGPTLYGKFASKEQLSRALLSDNGMSGAQIRAVPNGEAFDTLVLLSGQTSEALTAQLYAANQVGALWYLMASVGMITACGLYVYGRWTYRLATS
jgi:POT family proton-dependent oligopeptide transporter